MSGEYREETLRIVDVDLVWLFLVDLSDWLSDVPKAGRSIYHTELATGMINYPSPKETNSDITEILCKDEVLREELEHRLQVDLEVIDAEYVESQRFIRLRLKGFKIDLLELGEQFVSVNASLHRSGIGVLTMTLSLRGVNITPSEIINLELLPKSNEILKFRLPLELVREYSKINAKVASTLKDLSSTRQDLPLEASLNEIVWYYWSSMVDAIWKIGSEKKLLNKLRYEVFMAYPALFIRKTSPEYMTPNELTQKHPKQVYGILTQVLRQPMANIRSENVNKMLGDDLSERVDVSTFIALESTLIVHSEKSWRVLTNIAETRKTSIEHEYLYDVWTLLNVIEFLQVQRQILWLYDSILASSPGESLSPRQLAKVKEDITRGIDEFYNIKVAAQREAWEKIEYGKKVFMITDLFDTVTGKLSLLAEAANTLHSLRMEAFGLALSVMLSVTPFIFNFPELLIVIGNCVMVAAYLLSGAIWKRRRKKK